MVNLGFTQKEGEILAEFMADKSSPHVLLKEGELMHMEIPQWVKAGRPFMLSVVARTENYTGVLDTGYGKMYLLDTETGEVSQALNHIATLNDAVFLDKKYYGVNHWIFIAENEKKTKLVGDILDFIQGHKFPDAEQLLNDMPENIEKQKLRLLLRKEKLRATLHADNDADQTGVAKD